MQYKRTQKTMPEIAGELNVDGVFHHQLIIRVANRDVKCVPQYFDARLSRVRIGATKHGRNHPDAQ